MNNDDDIVISAFGCVTPLGSTYDEIKEALEKGRSGIRENKKYDVSSFESKYAGIPEIGNERICWPHKGTPVIGDILYARTALKALKQHDGFSLEQYRKDKVGCYLGVDEPVADIVQAIKCIRDYPEVISMARRAKIMSRHFRVSDFLNYSPTAAMKQVRSEIAFSGPAFCHVGLCSASLQAIGSGYQALKDGRLNAVIVGGVSAKISPEHYVGLEAADVIATDDTVPPEERSRPFDQWRSGYVPAEGAVLFILERRVAVENRGSRPLLKIAGYGASLNASHVVKPHTQSLEMILAMKRALGDSGISSDEIDIVNTHGTSTQLNDFHESFAINEISEDVERGAVELSVHGRNMMVVNRRSKTPTVLDQRHVPA